MTIRTFFDGQINTGLIANKINLSSKPSSDAIEIPGAFVATDFGNVYGYDETDGTRKWYDDSGNSSWTHDVGGEGAYYEAEDEEIRKYESDTGSVTVIQSGSPYIYGTTAINRETLYSSFSSDGLLAYDLVDKQIIWQNDTDAYEGSNSGDFAESDIAVVDGVLYTAFQDGTIVALDSSDGTKLWETQAASEDCFSLTVIGNILYFYDNTTTIYAFNLDTKTVEWSVDGANATFTTDGVFVSNPNDNDNFVKRNLSDGSVDWTTSSADNNRLHPAVDSDYVYFDTGYFGEEVVKANKQDGSVEWTSSVSSFINKASFGLKNGIVFVPSATKWYTLDKGDGSTIHTESSQSGGYYQFGVALDGTAEWAFNKRPGRFSDPA